ncbi:MAG: hypothetical protein AB1899_12085 [Pseudomonadota bacterium]
MEIGSLNSASYAPLKAAEPRAVADRPRAEDALQARQARRDALAAANREETRNAREADEVQSRPAAQPVEAPSGGDILFEDDQGTRVMKVLDSKDVLIYQVPPKGELTLIRAAEAEAQRALAQA